MAFNTHTLRASRRFSALATAIALVLAAPVAQADSTSFWSPFKKAYESILHPFGGDGQPPEDAKNKAVANTPDMLAPTPIDQPNPIRDLAYGDVLFDYYQAQYFAAITKILVAQERGLLKQDSQHAQIVLGALYVSYGMLDKGEAIFNQLLQTNATPDAADEAWYQLARIYYKRGQTQHALDLLSHNIVAPLETRATEHVLLQILCDIRLGDTDGAKGLLPYLKDKQALSVFVRFNMGSAFAQLGDTEQAANFFSQVSQLDARSEDDRTLKDRASLALGVHLLQQEKWTDARTVLERIRLFGPAANRGLLALGWTYFNSDKPADALTPWLELSERELSDPAVQESLLDIPYVYEQQGALREALSRYRDANKIFRRQRNDLEKIKQDILKPEWIRKISPVSEDTQDVMGAIPTFQLPADDPSSRYLYMFFASNEFQQIYRDYRELQRLYMVLVHWQRQLPSFNQMITTNVQRLDKLAPRSQKAIDQSRRFYAYARVRLDDFTTRLNQIIANDDLAGTATVQQMTQKQRLDEAEATLKSLGDPEQYEDEWHKLKLLKGLLIWDMNATAIDRRWEMTKDRVAIENLLADLEASIRRVQQARDYRMERFSGFENRIQELDQRITELQGRIAGALQDNRHYLQAVALDTIEQHQKQLDRMRAKSLLAIARLQDKGYIQERERQDQAQKPALLIELGKTPPADQTGEKADKKEPADDDIPVSEKNAARSLSDVIRKIFSE